jgi:hypothetical protein
MSIDLATKVLAPYTRNCNTGNKYEIKVLLHILRFMGLTNGMIDSMAPLIDGIKAYNSRNGVPEFIDGCISHIRTVPVGTGFILDGERIVDLRNTTQDDGDGKTADVIAVTASGAEKGISMCGGKPCKGGKIAKCLINPSATSLGATPEDVTAYNARATRAVTEFKADKISKYGMDESAWPTRLTTPAAVTAASDAALIAESRFASLPYERKVAIFQYLLHIDEVSAKPADYLAIADPVTTKPNYFYKFGEPVFPRWEPRIVARGIYLDLYNCDTVVGRLQVKFNNGVYHKGKTSSLYSSWNFTVNLRDIFDLKGVSTVVLK